MRRKITKAEPIEAGADLPDLTDKQQKFVGALLEGNTSADAYRRAYDTENMASRTIWAEASRLRADRNVAAWLAAARKAGLGRQVVTLEGHLAELENLRQIAIETGNVGAAVQAEQLRGKVAGHYVERLEVKHDDPMAILRELAAISPTAAADLARQNGIDWPTEH